MHSAGADDFRRPISDIRSPTSDLRRPLLAPLAFVLLALAPMSALADVDAPPPLAPSDHVPPVPTPSAAPPEIDTNSPNPPPSAYDRQRGMDGTLPDAPETITGQLFKTVLALAAVVGLIYLLFRFGPAKLLLAAQTGRAGKLVRVVERVVIDQKSSLVVVDIGGERLLLGSGDGGLRVLARMDTNGAVVDIPLSQPSKPFRSIMDATRPKSPSEDDNAPK